MTYYQYLKENQNILNKLKQNGYKDGELYRINIYEKYLELLPICQSVKATLLTMEQSGYGSISTIKRIRRRMEQEIK